MKKILFLLFFCMGIILCVCTGLSGAANLKIETAPVFADSDGTDKELGTFADIYSEAFTFGTPVNTGSLADYNDDPPLNIGNDFWIKSAAGVYSAPINQMIIQLEGADDGFNGGMFDIMNNVNKHDSGQSVPAGKEFLGDYFRIGAYDISFPSEPSNISTGSKIQNYVTFGGYTDPGAMTLDPNSLNWQNIENDEGGAPVINSAWDGLNSTLDIFYEFQGSTYWADALEDQALRMVTLFEGDLPIENGNGDPGDDNPPIPEPSTVLLFGFGILAITGTCRKKIMK